MKKIFLVIDMAFSCLLLSAQADCDKMMADAGIEVKKGNYRGAIQKFNAAKRCNPRLSETADENILKVFDEIENLKLQAEKDKKLAEVNLQKMSDLIVKINDLLQDEKFGGIIGFAPLKSELIKLILPEYKFISQNSANLGKPGESARAHLQLSFSYDDLGNYVEYENEVKLAFNESRRAMESFGAKTKDIPEELFLTFLRSALFYSWNLMSKKELAHAKEILSQTQKLASGIKLQSAKIYFGLAGVENAQSKLMNESNDSKQAEFFHSNNAVKFARKAVLMDSSSILYKSSLATHLRNLSLLPDSLITAAAKKELENEGCELADNIYNTPGTGGSGLLTVVDCIRNRSFGLVQDGKYDEGLKILKGAIDRLDIFIQLNPSDRSYILKRALVYTRIADIEAYNKSNKKAELDNLNNAIQDWLKVVKGEVVNLDRLWELTKVYDDIQNHITHFESKEEQLKISFSLADAVVRSESVYGNIPAVAKIIAKSYANVASFLLEEKKGADTAKIIAYLTKAINAFERAKLIEDYSSFDEDYALFCKVYDDRNRIYIAKNNFDAAAEDFNKIRTLFGPVYDKYKFDFYLGQHFWGSAMRFGEFLFKMGRFAEAIPILDLASESGIKQSTKYLIEIYETNDKLLKDTTVLGLLKKRFGYQYDGMKKFTIPCDFGNKKAPFDVYVSDRGENYPYKGIDDQAEWLWQARGGKIPEEVKESFRKLQALALKNNISFTELTAYALEAANQEKEKKQLDSLRQKINTADDKNTKLELFEKLIQLYETKIKNDTTKDEYKKPAALVYMDYANYLKQNNEEDLALEKFRRAYELDPSGNPAVSEISQIKFSKYGKNPERLAGNATRKELLNYMNLYLKTGDKKNADIISKKILFEKITPELREEMNKAYDSAGYNNFAELIPVDIIDIKEYRKLLLKKVAAEDSNILKINYYLKIVKLDEALLKTDTGKIIQNDAVIHLNSLAWYYLLTNQPANAGVLIRRGLELDKDNVYLQGNTPHVLLLSGKTKQAKLLYLKLKDLEFDKKAGYPLFKDAFLSDFADFKKAGISQPAFGEITQLLQQ